MSVSSLLDLSRLFLRTLIIPQRRVRALNTVSCFRKNIYPFLDLASPCGPIWVSLHLMGWAGEWRSGHFQRKFAKTPVSHSSCDNNISTLWEVCPHHSFTSSTNINQQIVKDSISVLANEGGLCLWRAWISFLTKCTKSMKLNLNRIINWIIGFILQNFGTHQYK